MHMTTETRKELETLGNDIAELRKDLRSLVEAMGSDSSEHLHEMRERLSERLSHGMKQVRQGVGFAKDYGKQAVEQTRQTVTEHPLSTVLAAVGIGALLGLMLRGRG
jgi:ElaB/YqjD/DUF883 family membrane-anchored ribosome-binding protein